MSRLAWHRKSSLSQSDLICQFIGDDFSEANPYVDTIHCRITQRVDFLYESGLATGKGEADDLMSKKITLSGPKQPDLSQVSEDPVRFFFYVASLLVAGSYSLCSVGHVA